MKTFFVMAASDYEKLRSSQQTMLERIEKTLAFLTMRAPSPAEKINESINCLIECREILIKTKA